MKRIILSFIIYSLVIQTPVLAQNCAQVLRLARSTYEQGHLRELDNLLKNCIKDGFSKEEKIEAYKLLTMSYLYLEYPQKADSSMLLLLKTDPYFQPNESIDPAEFTGLYNTFRTTPLYRIGVRFAVNYSRPNAYNYNPISDGTAKYSPGFGIGAGFIGEFIFDKRWTLGGELTIDSKNFSNNSTSTYFSTGNRTEYSNSKGDESEVWLSFPVVVQYYILPQRKNTLPYLFAGPSISILANANIQGIQKRINNQSIDTQSFSLLLQRNKINFSAIVGAGVKTRFAGGYLLADIRYHHGISLINSASTLFDNERLLNDYKIIDGTFSLNSLSFNFGYVQNFFNTKKLKRKK